MTLAKSAKDAKIDSNLIYMGNVCLACDKIAWSDFERTKCGPKGERQEA